jgi:hypothetical protein
MSLDAQAKLSLHLADIGRGLSEVLDEQAGERVLFALVIFGDGTDGRGQYVSNALREDVVKALQELLDHWKAHDGKDDGPYHLFRKGH